MFHFLRTGNRNAFYIQELIISMSSLLGGATPFVACVGTPWEYRFISLEFGYCQLQVHRREDGAMQKLK
jgi:hypothetical protein